MKNMYFKKFRITFFAILMMLAGSSIFAFEVTGDSFKAEFKITSWTASNTDSTITSEGMVGEGFGKVYLTHNFRSRFGDNTQGDFDGQVRSINNDGVMVTATLQGIWKREGKIVNMYTLDTFSDGDMIYAEGKVDLVQGTLNFEAFEF
tara:strand:- start:2781 stop:3224 length:444 start_codon:yes stop_codon:yes gene_type:complete